jgi:hypothetical protein
MPSDRDILSIRTGNGKKLSLTKGPGWKDSYLEELITPLLDVNMPDEMVPVPGSRNTRIWKLAGEKETFFIKFFNFRGIKDKLIFLRKSRSKRAMEGDLLIAEKGFLSPPVIAQGDIAGRFLISDNFLVSGWIEDSLNIYEYVRTFYNPPLSDGRLRQKRTDIAAAGSLIGKLHKRGVFHGDLRPGNILMKPSAAGPFFYLVDNERTRCFSKGLPFRLREKNLVQMNMIVMDQITFTDRMRFFRAYLSENPELEIMAKDLIRRVCMKTEKRLSQKTSDIWNKTYG